MVADQEALERGQKALEMSEQRAAESRTGVGRGPQTPGSPMSAPASPRVTTAARELRRSYHRLRRYRLARRRAVEVAAARDRVRTLQSRLDRSRGELLAARAGQEALERHHAAWRADQRMRRRAVEQADGDDRPAGS